MNPYSSTFTAEARRDLGRLHEKHATAVIEFVVVSLVANPRRLGRPLSRELNDRWVARRGVYCVIYRIDDTARSISITRIAHRSKIYRPR